MRTLFVVSILSFLIFPVCVCVNLFILNKCSCWRICQNGRPKIIQKIGRSHFAYILLLFSLTPSLKMYCKLLQWKVPCLVPFITSYVCICIYVRFLLKIYHGMTVLWVYFFAKNKMLYFISNFDGSRNTCILFAFSPVVHCDRLLVSAER